MRARCQRGAELVSSHEAVLPILCVLCTLAAPAHSKENPLGQGDRLYFQGDLPAALKAYESAVRQSSASAAGWLDGAVVLDELGQPLKAMEWYRKAAATTSDPDAWTALGWSQWRNRRWDDAQRTFDNVLVRAPSDPRALVGAARVALDSDRAEEALAFLKRAGQAQPLLTLVPYYEGKAFEALGKNDEAVEAYRAAAAGDSYFIEGKDALGRALLRARGYNDAWRQFSKFLDSEPRNKRVQALLAEVQPLLTKRPSEIRPAGLHLPMPYIVDSPPGGAAVPLIRVGIGTNALGKPRARRSVSFRVSRDFELLDAETGRRLLSGDADDGWQIRLKKIKRKLNLVVLGSDGKTLLQRRQAVVVRPKQADDGVIVLDDVAAPGFGANTITSGKILRGRLEIAPFKGNLRLVNVLDLENYTHGVLAAEMPIKSPIEALKAQAIIARSHALFIKKVTRRHRKDGYDVCDGEHCQMYAGVRAESQRSREVVDGTRGRIVTYKGQVAHVIYSSNCGGFTQNGRDLTGWGDVPYWSGVADAPDSGTRPASPWELRRWLLSWPGSYCRPSTDVHPSHFRWTRVISWRDLDEKVSRKLKLGRLKELRVLRRSAAGNVNTILVKGTRRSVKVKDEMQIRGLLGMGSLRSTLFVMELEYAPDGKPETVVFHGGGWGHGVGLCQSGAMGRAEAGEDSTAIIKAYFKGVELGQLRY